MTIITPTGVAGINSITSSGNSLSFRNASGASIDVSGLKVAADSMNVSGIVTATGFVGNVTGNINASGVSTIATLRATSIVGVTTAGITTAYIGSVNDGPIAGNRNRIINGDMRIDQRNAGASVTINASSITYSLDRWAGFGMATAGVFTLNRSTTAPSNFTNSLAAVCTTADGTIAAGDRYFIDHRLEGFNAADFGFGAASAKTITLSFWVQSSLTGTYCVAFLNSAGNRSYVAEYTINVADTWEYKTITVAGDTSGTWLSDNGIGIATRFALAIGATYQTTANAWAAGNFNATANQVNWMSSNSSRTFYITGVQLEPGTVATPFERRSYGQELALCQRYCHITSYDSVTNPIVFWGYWSTSTFFEGFTTFPVTMRTYPTLTISTIGSLYALESQVDWRQISSFSANESGPNCAKYGFTAATNTSFTKGQGGAIGIRAAGTVQFSSEI